MEHFKEQDVKENNLGDTIKCVHCGAIKFQKESVASCCDNGKIKLKSFTLPIPFVRQYSSPEFKKNARAYNSMFAFTSIGTTIDKSAQDGYSQCYRISGELYHQIGSLCPTDGGESKFAQIYLNDPTYQHSRRKGIFSNTNDDMIKNLTQLLFAKNPYVKTFEMLRQKMQISKDNDYCVQLRNLDSKVFNKPTVDEVAAIITNGSEGKPRDICVKQRNGGLKRISELHSAYDALQYPLLFPNGSQGWHTNIFKRQRKGKVTQREFYAYHGFSRDNNKYNPLELAGPIIQQYWVDQYCKIESNRINWIKKNQKKLRLATKQSVQNAVQSGHKKVGKIILPSSYTGGPRYYYEQFLDAMAGVRKYGQPDLFVTMTANPDWDEIKRELGEGENPRNRPMLIARVFREKLKALIARVTSGTVFGKVKVHVGTIEFQKRGLPHAHILFILDDKCKLSNKNPNEFDQYIYAEIPDPQVNPILHHRVTSHMIHKPCDIIDAPCIQDSGYCKSNYPKPFCDESCVDEKGFPIYRRRDNGREVVKKYNGRSITITNKNVVPYNPILLIEFNCHINVEVVSSISSVKYLFKYLHKGDPMSCMTLQNSSSMEQDENNKYDETKKFINGRYISAGDACWRILGFPLIERDFIVERLPIHLPNMQSIVFDGDEMCNPLIFNRREKTKLTSFFQFCKENRNLKICYDDLPSYAIWINKERKWRLQKRTRKRIGRLYSVKPTEGERFYLRVLLQNVISPTSFKSLKTYRKQTYSTFKDAAIARNLLQGDHENYQMLDEAASYEMPSDLRQTFATMLLFCNPTNPKALFDKFEDKLTDDFKRAKSPSPNKANLRGMAAYDINEILEQYGSSFSIFIAGVPLVVPEKENKTKDPLFDQSLLNVLHFNDEQQFIFDKLRHAIEHYNHPTTKKLFMINARAGSGKTYLLNGFIANLIETNVSVAPTAAAAIAASLLINGDTAHSTFCLPVEYFDSSTTCNINYNSAKAQYLRKLKVIIIDEVPMLHKHLVEAIERTLRDIMDNDLPFGGKLVVLCGDFRQTLPVIINGSRPTVVGACVQSSYLWKCFEQLNLKQNHRQNNKDFDTFLRQIGNGTYPSENETMIELPQSIDTTNSEQHLIDSVYPDMTSEFQNANFNSLSKYYRDRVILATTNKKVDSINALVLANIPGKCFIRNSFDSIEKYSSHGPMLPLEDLNQLLPNGFPPHKLELKLNIPIIILRNLNKKMGICNGTRAIITKIMKNTVKVRIISGRSIGLQKTIFKIQFRSSQKENITMKRFQLPIKPCFAMTINKAQGQTVEFVGVNLEKDVFSHGQLYVALSRVRDPANLHIFLPEGKRHTRNIVYFEVLEPD